ncbi:CaiB/BaiF CoA transferase family protein [Acrocarpospora catenulata]|uniref:CaiB/BaiF CoA transferase family protein n=1 Tax=Acrocarpospora catenulata TaxID=2836182 RepID=UPI001BDAD080|nr:CoA transferase [Acrocarpospora catenulata]
MSGPGPLAGVTVLDTTNMLMGPYATLLLGELGARVIKVEPPEGDISRAIDDRHSPGLGPIYLNTNRGKESIALNLRDPRDHEVFLRLVAAADVVAHNRPAGSEQRLGLDYDSLAAVNPRIIVCGMNGFGATGRYGPLPAYDDVIQGVSGVAAHQSGDGPDQYVRTPLTDKVTGVLAVGAVCAALYERERSGVGQYIEVPMFETMVQFLLVEQQGGHIYDPPRGAAGYARTNSPHRRPMRTADGLISILPSTDAHWRSVFRVLGGEDLGADPRFATISARTANIDELYRWMSEEIARRPTDELLGGLQGAGVPAMHVNTIEDLFEDPHLQETGFLEEVAHPEAGKLRQARAPFRFSRSGSPRLGPAPVLDGDSARLRAELGVPEEGER